MKVADTAKHSKLIRVSISNDQKHPPTATAESRVHFIGGSSSYSQPDVLAVHCKAPGYGDKQLLRHTSILNKLSGCAEEWDKILLCRGDIPLFTTNLWTCCSNSGLREIAIRVAYALHRITLQKRCTRGPLGCTQGRNEIMRVPESSNCRDVSKKHATGSKQMSELQRTRADERRHNSVVCRSQKIQSRNKTIIIRQCSGFPDPLFLQEIVMCSLH